MILNRKSACGNVFPLVLGVLLMLSILMTVMLRLPGTLRRTVAQVAHETQEMYLAESAVLAKLESFPEGYFAELPSINFHVLGPWTEWQTFQPSNKQNNKFQFLLGNAYARFSTSEWARCAVALEHNLHERILQANGLKNLSGNRRFFELDSSLTRNNSSIALNINAGDLTLDLGGFDAARHSENKRVSAHSFMAVVEGDVKIRGRVHFDTLRIYAKGTILLQGNVSANFVEIFGLAGVRMSGDISLSGLILSKQNIEISGRAKMNFPSVAIAVGYRENRLTLREKSKFEGLALAPSGVVERDSSTVLLGSTKTLLPFCMESQKVVFERRRF